MGASNEKDVVKNCHVCLLRLLYRSKCHIYKTKVTMFQCVSAQWLSTDIATDDLK